jgi:glucose/arabinose dehydrogenase
MRLSSRLAKTLVITAAAAALTAGALVGLSACGDDEEDPPPPPGSAIRVKLDVPAAYRTSPFNEDRYLDVPPGFAVSVVARVPGARFMAITPDGYLLVSRPGEFDTGDPAKDGKIFLVKPQADGTSAVTEFSSGLRKPHDLVFTEIDGKDYLYISESHQVIRAIYNDGDATLGATEVVLPGLPDNYTGELRGNYGHALKNIAINDGKLFLSVASATNADPSDVTAAFKRAAVYVSDLEGDGLRLFAEGVRNAEGLDFAPNGDLWVVINHRDNLPFPPGHAREGQKDQLYINDHPAEPFTRIRDGANYGWPYCNPNPEFGMTDLPYERDWENNRDGQVDCATMDKVNKGIKAHSAPLGLSFLHDSSFPEAYRNGAVATLHGCWNCSVLIGHKVIYFPWKDGAPGDEEDLVSGWVPDPTNFQRWGRPVDAIPDRDGNLLISDDYSGTIYKLSYKKP